MASKEPGHNGPDTPYSGEDHMSDAVTIAWLAGILEGEGTFGHYSSTRIKVKMGDRDIIERVAKLWGTEVKVREDKRPNANTMYETSVYGPTAIEWMKRVYLLMGIRRKAKIMEILAIREEMNANALRRKKPKTMAAK